MDCKQTIMVFGAAGGIGSDIVQKLKSKYTIIAVDLNKKVNELWVEENIISCAVDLLSQEAPEIIIKLLEKAPPLYGAVFATGIMIPGSITDMEQQLWDKTLAVNVTLVYSMARLLIPYLTKQKSSHIIVLSSHLGVVGAYNMAAYSVSKAALIELVKCIALDYGDQGLMAHSISPGFVKTDMLQGAVKMFGTSKKWMFATGGLPKQHVDVSDVSKTVLYLLGQSCMNGENIVIDAGYSVR